MLLGILVGAFSACAQDWTPTRIVAITDYVALARQAQVSGDVEVKCLLDPSGSVVSAEPLSGHPLLKEQARQNALLWKFHRTGTGGKNSVTLTYRYHLEGSSGDSGHTVFVVDLPNKIDIVTTAANFNPQESQEF